VEKVGYCKHAEVIHIKLNTDENNHSMAFMFLAATAILKQGVHIRSSRNFCVRKFTTHNTSVVSDNTHFALLLPLHGSNKLPAKVQYLLSTEFL
jgi:hypothetical protein